MAFGKVKAPRVKENRLPLWKLLAWKSSDVTTAAGFLIVNNYLMLFCTDFLGMDAAVVGTILLVSNIIDFITDLIGGFLVDNTNTKLGKGRPYELAIFGMGICTMLMFLTPNNWSMGVKIAWIFFTYTFTYGVFQTLRNAAQQVYTIRAFGKNRIVIGKLGSYGGIITTLGSMVVSTTFPKLMASTVTGAADWGKLVMIFMVPLTLIAGLRFLLVKEDQSIDAGKTAEKVDLKMIWAMIKTNKYAMYYAGIMCIFNAVTSLGATSYYFKYIVGNEGMAGIISIMGTLLLPVMLIFPLFLKKHSAAKIVAVTGIMAAVGYAINGFAGASIPMLLGAAIIYSIVKLPVSYLQSIMMMDLGTYNEYNHLPRMDASISALYGGFGTQVGQGVGGFLMGIALSAAGYIQGAGVDASMQPESAMMMIKAMYSWVPLLMTAGLVVLAILLDKLNKEMPKIEAELAEREAAAKNV